MPKTIPAAGEAMPELNNATDKAVAAAMRELEGAIHDLMHMAEIASDTLEATFCPSTRIPSPDDNSVTYRITKHEEDKITFLMNDVALRSFKLNKAFLAAWNGEQVA